MFADNSRTQDGWETMNVGHVRIALVLMLLWQPASAIDPRNFNVNGDVTATYDDNQSQALRTRDKVEDLSLSAALSLNWFRPLTHRSLLVLSWFAEAERFDDIDVLDRNTFGTSLALRWQPDAAFTSPLFEWNIAIQDDNYRTDQRDSTVIRSQAFVTRRFTDRITLSAGGEYRLADSRSTVFDLRDWRIFWNADYLWLQKYAFYFTYSHIRGDVFSSAQRTFCNGAPATDILHLINASTAIEPDDAYNRSLCGDWLVYRLDATTNTGVLGMNMPFGKSASVDVSLLHADVSADSGISYQRNLLRASFLKRF
jgi:hypothetical protein